MASGGIENYQTLLNQAKERLPDSQANDVSTRAQGVARAIALLSQEFTEGTWKAFWRTAVDGLSATDVGTELGMSPQAVRKAKSRVLARLREEYRGLRE